MTLTITRPTISITGHYKPSGKMFNRKTSAQFYIESTIPEISKDDYQTIDIKTQEWAYLEKAYKATKTTK